MGKHRKGRGIDHTWEFVKYQGDMQVYALCKCGFHYGCGKHPSDAPLPIVPNPEALYPYCPICGSKKKRYLENVRKIDKYSWER